jgi:FtsP/CotA-like multicopper oxidase with cupredoxin domain
MKKSLLFALFSAAYVLPLEPPSPERALTNDNQKPAGTFRNVNTLSLLPGRTMAMSWVPEHPGNWLFHCHVPEHFGARGPLGALPTATGHRGHNIANHALQGMSGLVMGVTVHGKERIAADYSNQRRIRLLINDNRSSPSAAPHYGFALNENGRQTAVDSDVRAGPTIILERGKPVRIMVVNRTDESTAIHWHGIELESYFDGVAGFSGIEKRLSPVIAPRDSFEARFTPPRAGTFMYHTHVDEARQQRRGLAGMLVLDPGQQFDPVKDIPILVSSPGDLDTEMNHVLMNGRLSPPPLDLRTGVTYRLRFANITAIRPGLQIALFGDTALFQWTAIARDGADLPQAQRVMSASRVGATIGRTADFEITPTEPGEMRLEMQTSSGRLLGKLAIVVRR